MVGNNLGTNLTFVPKSKTQTDMKVTALIRKTAKKNDKDSSATIYFRLRDGKKDIKAASELMINPNHWNPEKMGYKDRVLTISDDIQRKLNEDIKNIIKNINDEYTSDCDNEWLNKTIAVYHHPNRFIEELPIINESVENEDTLKDKTLLQFYDYFMENHDISEVRKKNFKVIGRVLARFELYCKMKKRNKNLILYLDDVTPELLEELKDYFYNEHLYYKEYPFFFEQISEKRKPTPRGGNTFVDYFNRIRTFFLWCYSHKFTTKRPFDDFKIGEAVYGTPIIISKENRNKLYEADLSAYPKVELQRDIFVFQAMIGCRPSDLYDFTSLNIIDDSLEYIADKTVKDNPKTLHIPLGEKAKEILKRRGQQHPLPLFPFIPQQKYNEMIKEAIKLSGMDHNVVRLNPTTRKKEIVLLSEVASAYTARKTFIGNIYTEVQDPDIISSMSGHVQGSKAFRRYRAINTKMQEDAIKSIE